MERPPTPQDRTQRRGMVRDLVSPDLDEALAAPTSAKTCIGDDETHRGGRRFPPRPAWSVSRHRGHQVLETLQAARNSTRLDALQPLSRIFSFKTPPRPEAIGCKHLWASFDPLYSRRMRLTLVPHRVAEQRRYSETGKVAFVRSDARYLAIVSNFPLSYWRGRAAYNGHFPHHRVALYDARAETRLGVFDGAHYRVNDVAFHPAEPIVAIATGEYDGGWAYNGDLFVWNWRAGTSHSVIRDDREVDRCRFEPDGRLAIVVKPPTDEIDEGGGALMLDSLGLESIKSTSPVNPAALGFTDVSDVETRGA